MQKHPYRALLIWVIIVIALVNIYPTVGWMLLSYSDGAQEERLEKWTAEDDARAAEKPGPISDFFFALKRWSQFDRDKVINLGLDLQGGIHMVMRLDYHDLDPETLQQYRDDGFSDAELQAQVQETVLQQVRRRVNDFEAKEPIIQTLGDDKIQIQLPGEKDIERARRLITMAAVLNFHIVAGMDETVVAFNDIKKAFPEQFTPFINRPAPDEPFFSVRSEHYDRVKRILKKAYEQDVIPEGKRIAFSQPPKPFDEQQEYILYLVDDEPIASGDGLQSSYALPDDSNPPYWQILFSFNATAGDQFGQVTEANMGRPMAIVVDDVVISAPTIRGRITTSGQITGSFEGAEARDLAIALNSGSMKVPVHEEFTRVVGPTLGAEAVRAGVVSALTGIALVGVFMLFYYMGAGIIALAALALNAIFIVAAMAYFDMTLTLPGIAGLILTIGMAVDANVLIFERIREELNLGHSLLSSIESGFARATVTILDANVTTLIAAAVLMQFGTGPIEGFAVTLSIGVISSVFTALVISRALMDFAVGRGLIKELKMLSVIHLIKFLLKSIGLGSMAGEKDTKIPFLQARFVSTVLSVILIAAGLTIFGLRGKENLGVDFTQGTNLILSLDAETEIPAGDVRAALVSKGFVSPVVQKMDALETEQSNQFIIRVSEVSDVALAPREAPGAEEAAEEAAGEEPAVVTVSDRIKLACARLTASGAVDGVGILDEETVGPAVGKQLSLDAMKALLFALVFIVVYLWLRFELRFAVAAVIALVHDILITIGVFALLQKQLTMPIVAALLTIIGYSLNDTIVVFDRIREDMGVYRGKGYKFIDILNMSINSTLSRTLLTSVTTLFVVGVLFTFGGRALGDFALALILGVIVGTYSSIFIASPVVYVWQRLQGRHVEPTDTGAGKGKKKNGKKGKGPKKNAQATA